MRPQLFGSTASFAIAAWKLRALFVVCSVDTMLCDGSTVQPVLVAGISLSQCQHLQPLLCTALLCSALGQSMPRSSIFYYALTFLCSPVFTAMAADLRPTQLVYPGVTGIARNYLDKSLLVSMVPRLLIKFFSWLAFIGFPAFDFNALSIKFYTNFACMQILWVSFPPREQQQQNDNAFFYLYCVWRFLFHFDLFNTLCT